MKTPFFTRIELLFDEKVPADFFFPDESSQHFLVRGARLVGLGVLSSIYVGSPPAQHYILKSGELVN